MKENNPHSWVIVRIEHAGETLYKVLAGWYGGYAYGDSWKLNSGITKIKVTNVSYEIEGYSGSVYSCHQSTERLSGMMAGVLASFEKQMDELGGTIQIVPIEEILALYP